MEFNSLGVLGQDVTSEVARRAIEAHQLTEIRDDPPFVRYYCTRERGLSLLSEHDRIVDIQVFVQRTRTYSAFTGPLPFGIRAGMRQEQVHELLGAPTRSDEFDSI
ncbi:MAG TPA: hypothetical protein VGI81_27155 [Tepidisphaeraceae bacterium]|jgi:hypothetical protein